MSCGAAPCPPSVPAPQARPTWTVPSAATCGLGRVYYNTDQTYIDTCPSGSPTGPITVTVPAHTYSSEVDQTTANNLAMAAATAEAEALRVLTPCSSAPVSGNFILAENGDFLITEDDDFLITEEGEAEDEEPPPEDDPPII